MREIYISDITMKQTGKTAGFSLSFREKIELAKLLDKLCVHVIETSPITNVKIDSLLIKSIAAAVKHSVVAVPVDLNQQSVDLVWNALKQASHPRLQVPAPVSSVQMEYLAHKKPAAMLEAIDATVKACAAVCRDVEFIADDATRSDADFLYQAIDTAIAAGAGTITVCDTAGTMLPDEFTAFVETLKQNVPALAGVHLGIGCADELAMADSCAIAALRCGAHEIKAAACAAGTISLANIAKIISAKSSSFGVQCSIRTTQMKRILSQITWMCQTNRSKNSPFDNGVQSDDGSLVLTSHDDLAAVCKAVEKLGYDLSEEDCAKVYEAFTEIAAHRDEVRFKELDAIVAAAALQVPPTYRVESYVINSGNVIAASAYVKLQKNGQMLEGISIGDGPVDAAFLAIEQIVGHHYELDDFQIQAVTEGREAMGQTVVKLRAGGKLYSGRGISTDIIGASIFAYINAVNKIVYEEVEA